MMIDKDYSNDLVVVEDIFESVDSAFFSYKSEIGTKLKDNEALDILHSPSYFRKSSGSPVLGRVEGIYFVPNGYSRNKRFYPEELWKNTLQKPEIKSRLQSGMLGMLEHPRSMEYYDKEGLITGAHPMYVGLVTNSLQIRESDGKKFGVGQGYIVDTPVGRILDVLMRSRSEDGRPLVRLYMSSRAWGRYIGSDGKGNQKMDPKNYYLSTFDVVTDPGFYEATVQYKPIGESYESTAIKAIGDILMTCTNGSCKFTRIGKILESYVPKSNLLSQLLSPLCNNSNGKV